LRWAVPAAAVSAIPLVQGRTRHRRRDFKNLLFPAARRRHTALVTETLFGGPLAAAAVVSSLRLSLPLLSTAATGSSDAVTKRPVPGTTVAAAAVAIATRRALSPNVAPDPTDLERGADSSLSARRDKTAAASPSFESDGAGFYDHATLSRFSTPTLFNAETPAAAAANAGGLSGDEAETLCEGHVLADAPTARRTANAPGTIRQRKALPHAPLVVLRQHFALFFHVAAKVRSSLTAGGLCWRKVQPRGRRVPLALPAPRRCKPGRRTPLPRHPTALPAGHPSLPLGGMPPPRRRRVFFLERVVVRPSPGTEAPAVNSLLPSPRCRASLGHPTADGKRAATDAPRRQRGRPVRPATNGELCGRLPQRRAHRFLSPLQTAPDGSQPPLSSPYVPRPPAPPLLPAQACRAASAPAPAPPLLTRRYCHCWRTPQPSPEQPRQVTTNLRHDGSPSMLPSWPPLLSPRRPPLRPPRPQTPFRDQP